MKIEFSEDIRDVGGYMPCPQCGRIGETCTQCLGDIVLADVSQAFEKLSYDPCGTMHTDAAR